MAIPLYLAMTAAEFLAADPLPDQIAWMACHFSPYGTGITDPPPELPPKSLLILNDRTPVSGHDPQQICRQLKEIAEANQCAGVLLDFQRPDCEQTRQIVKEALSLPFPVIVSDCYAKGLDCPVFVSPPPLHKPLEAYLSPWASRAIWLDAALGHTDITVTAEGPTIQEFPAEETVGDFRDDSLCCHYHMQITDTQIVFSLQREPDDLQKLLEQAEHLNICAAVGLYQELKGI